ncbi:MAG: transcription termination/antitermination protein NusG [Promethearchaeota archaeon]
MRLEGNLMKIDSINQSNDPDGISPARHWYAIYTKPHAEDLVQEQLEKKNIPVFLPKICEFRFRRNKWQECIQPLFPNYLFARFTIPDEYYQVKWARGLKRILGAGDKSLYLHDSIIVFLKKQVNRKGLVQHRPHLKNADKIRVVQGPLEGLFGIVQGGVDAKGRVRILMDILHAGAKIELPRSYVEKFD